MERILKATCLIPETMDMDEVRKTYGLKHFESASIGTVEGFYDVEAYEKEFGDKVFKGAMLQMYKPVEVRDDLDEAIIRISMERIYGLKAQILPS